MAISHPSIPIQIQISNPSKWERSSIVKIPFPNQERYQNYQIYSDKNEEISSQIDRNTQNEVVYSFVAENIPSLTSKMYYLKPRDREAIFHLPEEGLLDGNDFYLENDAMRAVLEENGTITIMHRNPELENHESGEKIFAMGEELTRGSIWAGDSFFNCQGLNQICINSHPLPNTKKSKLLEANEFKGVIQSEFYVSMDSTSEWFYRPLFSIDKGESPVLLITLPCPPDILNLKFKVIFNLNFEVSKKIEQENHIILWNNVSHHGIVIIHPRINDIIQFFPNSKTQLTQIVVDFGKKFKETSKPVLYYALLPINADCLRNGSIDTDFIEKYVFDYYHPFEWEIIK